MVDFAKEYQKELEKIRAASAPSMIPAPRDIPAPPPKTEEVVPDIATIVTDRKARLEIARLVERHGELGKELTPLNKERKGLTEKIKRLAGTFGLGKAMCGEWRINYYDSPKTSLDKKALIQSLLDQGVQPSVAQKAISDATTTKPSYTLKITKGGAEEDDE